MSHTPLHTSLSELLALLRAVHWNAWVTHWRASGRDSYGDHLLFQRIYEGSGGGPDIAEEIDGLGERMLAMYGQEAVDAVAVQQRSTALLKDVQRLSCIDRALKLESLLLLEAVRAVKLCGDTGLALDNFLRNLADERSTVVYLLRQRIRKE